MRTILIPLILFVFSLPLYGQNLAIPSNTIPHTQTTGLGKSQILQVFESTYGKLSTQDITSGEFHLVRYEGAGRKLTKGKLVFIESSIGKVVYSAVTVKGSKTVLELIGVLRYENFGWKIYRLASTGDEFTTSDRTMIKTDNQTIAWYIQGINFTELHVWQRAKENTVKDKYLEKELARARLIVNEIFVKRAVK